MVRPIADQTISNYYEVDHDHLDGLFRNFQRARQTDVGKAIEFFMEFREGLQRHIIWEEEILFPLFERKTGLFHRGPTDVMRLEHRQIIKHLEEIHNHLKQNNTHTEHEEGMLLSLLSAHNDKEEYILYPSIDRSLESNERDSIFMQMKLLPKERYTNNKPLF
jgi:iron-sulfur cluster repair protein YtfE (RIC family)